MTTADPAAIKLETVLLPLVTQAAAVVAGTDSPGLQVSCRASGTSVEDIFVPCLPGPARGLGKLVLSPFVKKKNTVGPGEFSMSRLYQEAPSVGSRLWLPRLRSISTPCVSVSCSSL